MSLTIFSTFSPLVPTSALKSVTLPVSVNIFIEPSFSWTHSNGLPTGRTDLPVITFSNGPRSESVPESTVISVLAPYSPAIISIGEVLTIVLPPARVFLIASSAVSLLRPFLSRTL